MFITTFDVLTAGGGWSRQDHDLRRSDWRGVPGSPLRSLYFAYFVTTIVIDCIVCLWSWGEPRSLQVEVAEICIKIKYASGLLSICIAHARNLPSPKGVASVRSFLNVSIHLCDRF